MFVGDQAEEAITLYTSLFKGGVVTSVERYGPDEGEPEGSVKSALFTLNGIEYMAMDSSLDHQFAFTPSMSLFIECESLVEVDTIYQALSEGGNELMPIDNYGFSSRFGWLNDRFGVSWQINLA